MNDVSTENENSSSSMNASNKRKRVHEISSKLWHCRLDTVVTAPVVSFPVATMNEHEEPVVQDPIEPVVTHEEEQQ